MHRTLRMLYIVMLVFGIVLVSSGCRIKDKDNTPPIEKEDQPQEENNNRNINSEETISTDIPEADSGEEPDEARNPSESISYYVTGDGVRMRRGPAASEEVLLHLNYGTEVMFLSMDGEWGKIRYDEQTGYIHSDLLSDTEPEPRVISETISSGNAEDDSLASPKIIVKKGERILELWDGDTLYGSYPIGLGRSPEGDKYQEGDGRTPEGSYYVCTRNSNSSFYLSLGVSYPNKEDAQEALDAERIDRPTYRQIAEAINLGNQPPWNTAMGGEIMIHGMGSGSDWTAGCIAVDNDVMDILWKHCRMRTPITILP